MIETAAASRRSAVSLSDRFTMREGQILITGVEALVRLMLLQAERDRAAGLKTGAFVSGYRGSPLGTLDVAFARAGGRVGEHGIVVKPAVNEEMGATAVAGTQQLAQSPGAKVDGVFALWYGKGPGLDRAADAIRHGNYQGSAPQGGVVLAVGDDHVAKSSSIVCYSDETVASLQVPLFYPADPNEIVVYGLHGFAMSRHTGSWSALKIITEVADSSRAVAADESDAPVVLPEIAVPPTGLHNRWPETPADQETKQQDYRLPAVHAYVRANALDRTVLKRQGAHVGIVAAGKSWLDVLEAFRLLGLDEVKLAQIGVALYKPALIWPLEPQGLATFAEGLDTLVIVEEKSPFVENQVKSILYGKDSAPAVLGKTDALGVTLFPKTGDLTPERIAAELGSLLHAATGDEALALATRRRREDLGAQAAFAVAPTVRKPFFCSGCPHNRSTVVPTGSRATAGIGCHGLAAYNRPATATFSQMGGEGVHWMGMSPFTDEGHIFANLGDGTYFHSGIMAIRQAVAARLNITYKLLYNSAVAMTGGQHVDGELSVAQLIDQVRAEGVGTVVLCTDDPDRYPSGHPARRGADRVEHRDDLDQLQQELRATPGVSVIVYEQMCATEKRRLRKRGRLAQPDRRVFINERVCEDCGDCSAVSNCLSVEPVTSAFETKRRINQSSCNMDYSCVNGFCPSFVTVDGGKVRKPEASSRLRMLPALPAPDAKPVPGEHQRIVVAGVGGTGVVTISALLSMSAHLAGRETAVLDQVGMAQKGGAVASHIHISDDAITALRIPVGQADLVIACDQVVGNARDVIAAVEPGRSHVVANADVSVTGDFTRDPSARPDASLLARRLSQRAGPDRFAAFPFTRLAERLFGDAIASNLMMVGFAYQKGWLELDAEAFDAAVKLNGVGVDGNRAAFVWGRQLAVDPRPVYEATGLSEPQQQPETLDDRIRRRAAFLADYQDRAYADRYLGRIDRVRDAEARVSTETALTEAAAQALFRLMSYKDEYEVARLYTDGEFAKALKDQFEGPVRLSFHLAPPILGRRDKATGHLRKQRFGPWVMPLFRVLSRMKRLRGTRLDPFGYTAERRSERILIREYESILDRLTVELSAENLAAAIELAAMPLSIRGYGHIKERAIANYRNGLALKVENFERDTGLAAHAAIEVLPSVARENTV